MTPVTSNHVPVTLIFGLSPADAFQPPLTILDTMTKVDRENGVALYEFYREKAWQACNALAYLAEQTEFTLSGEQLARKLRSVLGELGRYNHLL